MMQGNNGGNSPHVVEVRKAPPELILKVLIQTISELGTSMLHREARGSEEAYNSMLARIQELHDKAMEHHNTAAHGESLGIVMLAALQTAMQYMTQYIEVSESTSAKQAAMNLEDSALSDENRAHAAVCKECAEDLEASRPAAEVIEFKEAKEATEGVMVIRKGKQNEH